MSNYKLVTLAAATMLFAGSMSGTARAADHEFCRDYAEASVRQYHYAEKQQRCEGYLRADRNRWQDNFKAHYDWCRIVSREAAWQQRNMRRDAINSCRDHGREEDYR